MSKFLFIIFFVFSFLFIVNFSFAAEPPPCECTSGSCCDGCNFRPSSYICDSSSEITCQTENQCEGAYGNNWTVSKCNASGDCAFDSSGWNYIANCPQEKACQGGSCVCSGNCLFQPTGPFPPDGDVNVKLPVTLMWNAVNGAQSYRYKIDGVIEDATTTPYITIGNCTLHSSSTYSWQVRACCDSEGGSCGPWSNFWTFKTSLAPEIVSPKNNSTGVPVPVIFTWCEVGDAQSYYLRIYRGEEENLFPFPILKKAGSLENTFIEGSGLLTPGSHYKWEATACLNEDGTKCGDEYDNGQSGATYGEYSQKWEFTTFERLPAPPLFLPEDSETVNQSNFLKWGEINGAFSYYYEIKKGGEIIDIPDSYTTDHEVSFKILWDYLGYGDEYTWHVKSCWDEFGENCEEGWSKARIFKTTGSPPTNLTETPIVAGGKVSIPATLSWDKMPGAASYYYQIATDNSFNNIAATGTIQAPGSEVSVEYPDLRQETQYYWRVNACADGEGKFCGGWSQRNFTTFKLSPPINPDPENNGEFLASERYLRWEGTAKFYQYRIEYQGGEKIPLTIVSDNSAFLLVGELELGEYTWYVRSCLDSNCQETSGFSGPWHFTLVQGECEKSLVPCGRDCDAEETSWDEREPCQLNHIFLLLNNILDFILWRLGLIILALLSIATGVIYYFSMGAPQTMVKIKSLLKSAGMGYGIIFLGWLIINLILIILGYQVGIFGRWWQIIF